MLKIQGALRHIDSITSKLREMHASVVADHHEDAKATAASSEKVEPPREPEFKRSKEDQPTTAPAAAEESARQKTNGTAAPAEHVAPQKQNSTDALLLKRFAKLKLDPRFDVQETQEGFTINAYCPNLGDTLKVTINDTQDVLTISGTRLPTSEELASMRQRVSGSNPCVPRVCVRAL